MKKINFAVSTLILSLTVGMGCAQAFGLSDALSVAGVGGNNNSSNTTTDPNIVVHARNSLYSFAKAQTGLVAAFGGYEELAAQQKMLDGMKTGDAAASKDDIETLVKISKSTGDVINKKIADNVKLDANNKKLAASSSVEYVKGLISSKKLISSIQNASSNPMSLGQNAGAVLYVGKELPGIVSGGVSTTGSLLKYLTANGVDTSEVKKAADGLGN